MKRRRTLRILDLPWATWLPTLLPLAISFFLGSIVGCILAGGVAEAENGTLATYIEGYLSAARCGELTVPSLFSVLWDTLRWPLWERSAALPPLTGEPIFSVAGFALQFYCCVYVWNRPCCPRCFP